VSVIGSLQDMLSICEPFKLMWDRYHKTLALTNQLVALRRPSPKSSRVNTTGATSSSMSSMSSTPSTAPRTLADRVEDDNYNSDEPSMSPTPTYDDIASHTISELGLSSSAPQTPLV
jgi:hypothetical protein